MTRPLTDDELAVLAQHRSAMASLLGSDWAAWNPSCRNMCIALASLADGASIDDVVSSTGQPAWRVLGWLDQVVREGPEMLEEGYFPPDPAWREPRDLFHGIQVGERLVPEAIVQWVRGSWLGRDAGIDVGDTVVWLAWPDSSLAIAVDPDPKRIAHTRKYYVKDLDAPAGEQLQSVTVELIGPWESADNVNRQIDLLEFLTAQPGMDLRGRDGARMS